MLDFTHAMFDMDGTIIDSMKYWRNSVIEYAEMNNCTIDEEFEKNLKNVSVSAGVNYLKNAFVNTPVGEVNLDDIYEIMLKHYINEIGYKDGAVELLEFLCDRGIKLCLISASPILLVSAAANKLGFGKYFDFMMTCEEFPSGHKDDEAFGIAAKRLGGEVSAKTVVFEDAYYAVNLLKNTKIRVAAIEDSCQGDDLRHIKEKADWYFATPRAALEYFSKIAK